MAPAPDWDALTYEQTSDLQVALGGRVLDRLSLSGSESVVDVGCGTGRVTRMAAERVPDGHVVGIDPSPAMVDDARREVAGLAPRVEIRQASAATFTLDAPVDVAISTSALHWEHDHRAAFHHLFAALRPGGRLVAIFSPEGNLEHASAVAATVAGREPYSATIGDFATRLNDVFNFAPLDRIEEHVRAAGFEIDRLERSAQDFPLARPLGDAFLATSIYPFQVQALPEDQREPFVTDLADALTDSDGKVHLDGVTVLLDARRPG